MACLSGLLLTGADCPGHEVRLHAGRVFVSGHTDVSPSSRGSCGLFESAMHNCISTQQRHGLATTNDRETMTVRPFGT